MFKVKNLKSKISHILEMKTIDFLRIKQKIKISNICNYFSLGKKIEFIIANKEEESAKTEKKIIN